MVSISVSVDIKKAKKQLTRLQKKQIPFAVHQAINDSLFDARKAEQGAIRQYIDRPTPFTQKGFLVKKSPNKRVLRGSLEITPNRLKYLKYQVEGGTSRRAGKSHAIPVNAATNKYGNLPRNKVRTLLRQRGAFTAKIGGVEGVWKRDRSGLKLLIVFKAQARHTPRYPFGKAAIRVINAKFKHNLDRRLKAALRSAR